MRCLVAPWCDGQSFASLAVAEQRRAFPRMLPALWRALAVCPHGDLKPDAFLLDPAGFFRVLDPGVSIGGPYQRRAQPGGLDFHSRLFTTNAAHYALALPEHGPKAPQLRACGGGLEHVLETQHTFGYLDAIARPSDPHEPALADVLALGALYFQILTGESLATALELEAPLWTGFWSDSRHRPEPRHRDVLARLPRVLEDMRATPAERRFVTGLVMLEVTHASIEPLVIEALSAIP
jgi:hypothetical protein